MFVISSSAEDPRHSLSSPAQSTWNHPKATIRDPPPMPSSPPPSPAKDKDKGKDKDKKEIKMREADQWAKVDDGTGTGRRIWRNQKTEATQYHMPQCRVKYRK
eukprot:jgi/Undpi1/317/HiC_scaffold_1.g00313.m1